MTDILLVFDSIAALAQAAKDRPVINAAWNGMIDSAGSRCAGSAWYGTDSFDNAFDRATQGSPEDRATIATTLEAAQVATVTVAAPTLMYDVAGYRPHVARAIAGEPCCMIRRGADHNVTRPVFRLLVNFGASNDITGQRRVNRGAAIAAAVDAIEAAGTRVEIEAVMRAISSSGEKHSHETRIMLKQASDPMDIDALAFALVNPAVHRRFVFSLREGASFFWESYGSPQDVIPESGQVYLPLMTAHEGQWETPTRAAQYVQGFLESASQFAIDGLAQPVHNVRA